MKPISCSALVSWRSGTAWTQKVRHAACSRHDMVLVLAGCSPCEGRRVCTFAGVKQQKQPKRWVVFQGSLEAITPGVRLKKVPILAVGQSPLAPPRQAASLLCREIPRSKEMLQARQALEFLALLLPVHRWNLCQNREIQGQGGPCLLQMRSKPPKHRPLDRGQPLVGSASQSLSHTSPSNSRQKFLERASFNLKPRLEELKTIEASSTGWPQTISATMEPSLVRPR
jgi:hypothetical protein